MVDNLQGLSWNWDPQRLYQIKSYCCSSSIDFKSVSICFCVFYLISFIWLLFFKFIEFCFCKNFYVHFRKDTYGVFSEPVDPEEASSFSLRHINLRSFVNVFNNIIMFLY